MFGSFATGLALPQSDLDILVRLPRVRTRPLEPIVEADILEGHNSQHSSAVQQAARKLGEQDWLVADSLRCGASDSGGGSALGCSHGCARGVLGALME